MQIQDEIILEYLIDCINKQTAIVNYLEPGPHQLNPNYPVINIEVTYSPTSIIAPIFGVLKDQFRKEDEQRRIEWEEEMKARRAIPSEPKKNTYVYVMIDKRTGYYKIGRSKDPAYRERTLQSEAPDVELLFHYEAYANQEKTLHAKYAEKRVRGEWFQLTDDDIEEIKNIISND